MNHSPRSADCERFALVLPRLDDPDLAATSAARAHLQTCAACRADRAAYLQLDRALRQHYGLDAVPRRSTEEIMQTITTRTSGTEPRPPARQPRTRTNVIGVLAIVLIAVLTFVILGRRGAGQFNIASGPAQYTFPGVTGSLTSISMVSADEGWALGQTLHTLDGGNHDLHEVTLYHDVNGSWKPVYVPTSQSFASGGISGFNGTISMDSATDGWAVAHNFNQVSVVLHYANGTWTEVENAPEINTLQALAPNSVWAISGALANGQRNGIVHYDGTAWVEQSLPTMTSGSAGPGIQIYALDMRSASAGWALASDDASQSIVLQYSQGSWTQHSTYRDAPPIVPGSPMQFRALAMLAPDEGWALGERIVADSSGNTAHVPLQQLLYHYTNNAWHAAPLSIDSNTYVELASIQMLSATDGWIVGFEQNAYIGATVDHFQQQPVLYHYDGKTWQRLDIPATGHPATAITQLTFTADGTGWACGYVSNIAPGDTVQDTDILAKASPLLLTYTNGSFAIVNG